MPLLTSIEGHDEGWRVDHLNSQEPRRDRQSNLLREESHRPRAQRRRKDAKVFGLQSLEEIQIFIIYENSVAICLIDPA